MPDIIAHAPRRVGFDIDGVLTDFNRAFVALIKQELGKDIPPYDDDGPPTWNYHLDAGVTPQENDHLWWVINGSPDFWNRLMPLPHAPMVLEKLEELTVTRVLEPYFITSRPSFTAREQSIAWLRRWGISTPTVLAVKNAQAKAIASLTLGLQGFIDDNADNAVAIAGAIGDCHLYHRNYNWHLAHPKVLRIKHPYSAMMTWARTELESRA